MKVIMDDGHDWVFLNNDDGRVYDGKGKEIRWVPIDDQEKPKEFKWIPIGDEEDEDEEFEDEEDDEAYCPSCGAPVSADSNFCEECGEKLK